MGKIIIKNEFCLKLIIISVFVFNYTFREKFIPVFKDVNILFCFSLFLLLLINRKSISIKRLIGVTFLFLLNIIINLYNSSRINNIIYFNIQTIFPLLLLCIDFSKIENKGQLAKRMVNFYNIIIMIFFCIYIIDMFTNNSLSRFLATKLTAYDSSWIPNSIFLTRYRFYFAHPLYSSLLVMIFYCLNLACYKLNLKTNLNYWVFHIIAVVMLLSFGSKTPVVIFLILFYIFNYTPKRLLIGIVIAVLLIVSGKTDYILYRFQNDQSITSGRNESLSLVLPELLTLDTITIGKGEALQYILIEKIGVVQAGAAQEYPVLDYIFKYGIFFTIIILYYLIISPIVKCFKYKNKSIAIIILALFLELNTYNGLVSLIETPIIYFVFLVIIEMLITSTNITDKKFNYIEIDV